VARPLRIAYTGVLEHFTILHIREPKTSRRIAMKISQDNKLREKIRKIENKLKLSRMKTWPLSFCCKAESSKLEGKDEHRTSNIER